MNKESIIQIPFEFKKDELISLIDSLVPDTLIEKDGELPINLKILKGTISKINLKDKTIDISLSIKVFVEKTLKSYSLASAEGELKLDLYSEIDIDDKWNLKTKTSLVDYNWIEKPKLKLLGFNLSASDIIEEYIDYKQSDWMNQIDSTIAKSDILLKPVDRLMNFFSKPFTVDSAGTIGLKIVPRSISLSPFKSADNIIQSRFSLSFTNELVPLKRYISEDTLPTPRFNWDYIEKPEQKAVVTLVLDQNLTQTLTDDFITYQDSATKSFNVKENTIRIDNIDILFNKDIITGIVDFSGDKTGSITVKTRPLWNENQKKLLLLNRSADIKLNNFGTQFFINLFRKKIQKKIMDSLEETLNTKINEAVDETNTKFENAKFKNSLKISDFNMPIQLEDDFLMIDIDFILSGEISWNKLNIYLKK